MQGRAYAYATSLLLIAAVAYPACLDPWAGDSYPLSTYPMFSRHRTHARTTITSAVAIGADGGQRAVPPKYVASSEALQALVTLRESVRAGPGAVRALCRAIATRLGQSGDRRWSKTQAVEIVSQTVDAVDYLSGRLEPLSRRRHARCEVGS